MTAFNQRGQVVAHQFNADARYDELASDFEELGMIVKVALAALGREDISKALEWLNKGKVLVEARGKHDGA